MQIVHGHMKNPTLRFSGLCHQPGRQVVFPHGAKRAIPEQPHSGSAACRRSACRRTCRHCCSRNRHPSGGPHR